MVEYPPKTVYLSGPITGLDYGEAKDTWRAEVSRKLPSHIFPLSPMRVVSGLMQEQGLKDKPTKDGVEGMQINRSILKRDEVDLRQCDAMIAHVLGAERVSQGTVAELGMAHILRKPVVLIIEKEGNIHEHPFNTSIASFRTDDMDEAIAFITHLLTPGV